MSKPDPTFLTVVRQIQASHQAQGQVHECFVCSLIAAYDAEVIRATRAEAVVYEVADTYYGARGDMAEVLPEDWQCIAGALRDGGFTYEWVLRTSNRRLIVVKPESTEENDEQ